MSCKWKQIKVHYSHWYVKSPPSRLSFLSENYILYFTLQLKRSVNMSGQTQHSPVKTSNLRDKCPMTVANLQACNVAPITSATFRLEYKDDYKYKFSAQSMCTLGVLRQKFSRCAPSELVHKVLIVPQPKRHYWHGQAFEKKEKESRARTNKLLLIFMAQQLDFSLT